MTSCTTRENFLTDTPGVCRIAFIGSNSLRLANFPHGLVALFEHAVKSSWHKGIESITHDRSSRTHLVKLRGFPWTLPFPCSSPSPDQGIGASRLVLAMLRLMRSKGWECELVLSKLGERKDDELVHYSWSFTNTAGAILPQRLSPRSTDDKNRDFKSSRAAESEGVLEENSPALCCIDFSGSDSIRVVEGCSEVLEALQSCMRRPLVRLLERKSFEDVEQFQLSREPVRRKGMSRAELFIPQLMVALKKAGWMTYAVLEIQDFDGDNSVPIFNRWIMMKRPAEVQDAEALTP